MNFKFLGGASEVGRSAILINNDLLLDYGIKPSNPISFPQGALEPKTVIISHGHLDHCGLIPNLMDLNPEIYCTPMTANLTALLARDVLKIAENKNQIIPYYEEEIVDFERKVKKRACNQIFKTNGYTGCFYDAGHIPGSSMIRIEKDNKSLFYTGDFNTIDTELQIGANVNFPENDILMIESTYFGKNHTPRKVLEKRFIESIKETLDIGGSVIIAAFSIGRTQELMMLLKKHNISTFIDGMGKDVCKLIRKNLESVGDIRKFEAAYNNSFMVSSRTREKILDNASVVITSAGMLNGGTVLYYLDNMGKNPKSKLMLTGYQSEGTNGRLAIEKGYIIGDRGEMSLNCQLEHFDFSAHAGDKQLKKTVKSFCDHGTESVIAVHGDRTKEFAKWIKTEIGVNTFAPKIEESITI